MLKRVKKFRENTRGISPVIATVLIILITLASISVLWVVVKYFVVEKSAQPDACFLADVSLDSENICYDFSKNITSIAVIKGDNEVNITKIQFIFRYDQEDQSNIQEIAFDKNSKDLIYFDMSKIHGAQKPDKISIVPVVILSDGNERVCEASSSVSVRDCTLSGDFVSAYDGWIGCQTDAECILKAGNNPNAGRMKCVQFAYNQKGVCCVDGYCPSRAGGSGSESGPSGRCTTGTCENPSTKICGQTYKDNNNCNNCPDKGVMCDNIITISKMCYQESANQSNQGAQFGNPDGNCSLNYGGSYDTPVGEMYFYINYTKPNLAKPSSKWKVKHGRLEEQNLTIPIDCWNIPNNQLMFRIESNSNNGNGNSSSNVTCFDGMGWKQLSYDFGGSILSSVSGSFQELLYDGNWSSWSLNAAIPNIRPWRADSHLSLAACFIYEEAMMWDIGETTPISCVNGACESDCYQESANIVDQKGTDSNCELNYGGSYTHSQWDFNPDNTTLKLFDGNWDEFIFAGNAGSCGSISPPTYKSYIFNVNYNKPVISKGAKWLVKYNSYYKNYSIPDNCFNNNFVSLWVNITHSPGCVTQSFLEFYCKDNSGNKILLENITGFYDWFYEEAIIWNVTMGVQQTCLKDESENYFCCPDICDPNQGYCGIHILCGRQVNCGGCPPHFDCLNGRCLGQV